MPKYKYVARDRTGKSSSGHLQASDEADLRNILRANGLFLTQVRGTAGQEDPNAAGSQGLFVRKPTLQDMVIATRQLATMMRAGMPMMETLNLVSSQVTKPTLKVAFRDLEKAVSGGESLSVAMSRYPKVFSKLVVAFVESGEATGNLAETLEAAAIQLDREDNLRRKVKAATTYPKIVVAACVGTVAIMIVVVVPVFSQVYRQLGSQLPGPTQMLITVSDFVTGYGWLVLLSIAALAFGYKKYAESEDGSRKLDIIALKLPVLGIVFRKIAIARFVQTLSAALRSGVPVLHALHISGNMAGNSVIRDAVVEATAKIREGSPIAGELEKTGEFPLMVTRMLSAGESSGSLDSMLDEVNRFYDRDVEYSVDKLTRMIEPLMTILVGGIVLLILLALYMPVFNLGNALNHK
ncbi:MAG: type II secretion system F family protein [Fimbriimonas sp.]|nr:type II secretion system F family protein [Fimbriimonas sp.]